MNEQIGYKIVGAGADVRWRAMQSPTGRQLMLDGNLLLPIVTFDPNTSVEIPPDGTTVIYTRAGAKEIWTFDRANGWQQA